MLLNSHILAYARCLAGKVCGRVRSTWGTSQGEDKFGARDDILNTTVARRARAGRVAGKHSPFATIVLCYAFRYALSIGCPELPLQLRGARSTSSALSPYELFRVCVGGGCAWFFTIKAFQRDSSFWALWASVSTAVFGPEPRRCSTLAPCGAPHALRGRARRLPQFCPPLHPCGIQILSNKMEFLLMHVYTGTAISSSPLSVGSHSRS